MIKTNINDESLKSELIKVVLEFTSGMNLWEIKMYYLNRIEHGQFVKQEYYDTYKDLRKSDLYDEYQRIIDETCTIRDRVYGGNPLSASFGKVPSYSGINESSILELTLIENNKAEIIAIGGNLPDQYIKFVLFMKSNSWRIDQLFKRIADSEWIPEDI